ncbi:hypothetical protein Tco_1308367 [Tanacetum coccineum]
MLKKFGFEDSKPTKTPMSMEIKLTKDDEADSVDSSKYRGEIMSQMLHDEFQQTFAYAPKISNENSTPQHIVQTFRDLESRGIHEGCAVLPYYSTYDHIKTTFNEMGLYHVTAPNLTPEASVSIMKGSLKSGNPNTEASIMVFLSSSKESCSYGLHLNAFFFNNYVNGLLKLAKPLMNLL